MDVAITLDPTLPKQIVKLIARIDDSHQQIYDCWHDAIEYLDSKFSPTQLKRFDLRYWPIINEQLQQIPDNHFEMIQAIVKHYVQERKALKEEIQRLIGVRNPQ